MHLNHNTVQVQVQTFKNENQERKLTRLSQNPKPY